LRRSSDGKPWDSIRLDLYSLFGSTEAVIKYLERVGPEASHLARYRYSCFDHFGYDAQFYGYAASRGAADSCEDDVVAQLVELQAQASSYMSRDGQLAADELFAAEQNARVARNAEAYYRAMYRGGEHSWNLRDPSHVPDPAGVNRPH
jgi:erythromycin esterase-like protein